MTPGSLTARAPAGWRRFGAGLSLAASLAFVFQPAALLAQTPPDTAAPHADQPKPHARGKKTTHKRTTPTDNVSDDLNRRESQRAEEMIRQMNGQASASSTAVAVPTASATPLVPATVNAPTAPIDQPPTVAAIPARAPIATASLTPTAGGTPAPSGVQMQQAQVQAQIQAQAQPTSPAPVPIRPVTPSPAAPSNIATPATPLPPAPPAVGAPSRGFAQSQVVPTQQPTLTLEVSKGTAVKLPGAASTVFVAAPDIADVQVKSPGMIYVFAKKAGDTVLYAVDDQDRVLLNTIVHVTSPLSRIKAALDAQHPGNGVQFDNQGETIVMSGTVRSGLIAEDARRLALQNVTNAQRVVSNIRVDTPTQVQLRVKIAEVQRNSLKRMGINWQNINSIALFGIGPFKLGGATSTIQAIGGATSAGAIAATSNDGSLTSLVDLLANQGQANILAEPNLIAMSGETASFLAGGEIPVLSPQASNGGNIITVTYKQVGVSLAFTPTIIGDRINLKVAPEVSQVTTDGQVSVAIGNGSIIIPAIATRRASTTVELGSGQSFAIGGLLQQNSTQNVVKVPGLGDVPILGSLFKSDAYQRQETELVIIVTPYFVEPSSGPLRTPFSGRVPPTDADRVVYQRLNHPTPPATMSVSGGGRTAAGPAAGFKFD
ncbi:MAG: pilus assembly protein N-terminal domain-containing protein [Proteobacteria bacterium]|nr:pilus assembly protein N-terminal domain-containing protein [Pseudomonadota bacterium]